VPVMVLVALFVFSLLYIAPGDPAAVIAGDQATPADVERIRQSLGLDRPFLIRFGEWFWQVLHGDLGTSIFTNLPVAAMIAQRVEPTLSLMAVTLVIAVCVAVPMGVVAAWQADTLIDRAIMAFAVLGFSVPVFVVGYLLAYVFALELDWLPVQGYTQISEGLWPWFENLILPALALGCVYIALIARITRAAMLEVLQQDFIRTARAKGVGQTGILFVHALKNAAVPIVTVIGIGVALLIGGAVVTETVFAIPGIGRLTVDAILRRDYPVIQGVVLMFSFVYVLVNLLIDLLYTVLDPRIRHCPTPPSPRRPTSAAPRPNCRTCCRRSSCAAASSASCADIRRSPSAARWCWRWWRSLCSRPISARSTPQRWRRRGAPASRPRHSGSAPTCWDATSTPACSTGRACRSRSAWRVRCWRRWRVSYSASYRASFAGATASSCA